MNHSFREIQIDELTIRCFETKDAAFLKEAIDSSLEHLRVFMDWAHKEPQPLETKVEKIKKWRKDFIENNDFTFGIFRKDKFIGVVGLHKRLKGNALEIGYWIRADESGKGITTKAVLALVKNAFEKIKIARLEIHIYKSNIASGKIAEKLHFKKMPDYTFEKKDDSSWYVLDLIGFKENTSYYNTLFKTFHFTH